MTETVVQVENVGKRFCRNLRRSLWYAVKDSALDLLGSGTCSTSLRKDEFWANQGISFELKKGQCLGLIGRNGAGKTTLLKMLNGLIKPDTGRIRLRGRVGALIALGAGFDPVLTGRENIYVNASILGLSRRQIKDIVDDVVAFAEIEEFIDAPVRTYSSGMQVRLGFSVASRLKPDIFLIDEVLAVGDYRFKTKAKRTIQETIHKGTAVAFVSHNLHEVAGVADRCVWLERGRVRECGTTDEVISHYLAQQDQDDRSTSTGYAFSPKRSGFARLHTCRTNIHGSDIQSNVPQPINETAQLLEIDVSFSMTEPVFDAAWHGINLSTDDGRYIGRAVLEDEICGEPGSTVHRRLELRLPHLLAGDYRVEYFVWLAGGTMLEGVQDLVRLRVTPELASQHLRSVSDRYVIHKMGDNSRGPLPLDLTLQSGVVSQHK